MAGRQAAAMPKFTSNVRHILRKVSSLHESFQDLNTPIGYRIPCRIIGLVCPVENVSDDAAGSSYDTEAHQKIQ